MDQTPLYRHTGDYAAAHDELDAYLASCRSNEACRYAIENAINNHYDGYSLGRGAAQDVVAAFGNERTEYVLSVYIRTYEDDGRMGRDNISWAKKIPVAEEQFNTSLLIRSCSPALVNLFVKMARDEIAISQPVYKGSRDQADANWELKQYQESERANILCQAEIDKAIEAKWDGTQLAPDAAKAVLDRFGPERVTYVLANTVRAKAKDESISGSTISWARRVKLYGQKWERDSFTLRSSPDKLDEFTKAARREIQSQARRTRRPSVRKKIKD